MQCAIHAPDGTNYILVVADGARPEDLLLSATGNVSTGMGSHVSRHLSSGAVVCRLMHEHHTMVLYIVSDYISKSVFLS